MRLSRFVEFGRKIIGIGRNYKHHAAEMKSVVPDKPLLFLKPPTAFITEGNSIKVPKGCHELHHEVELGVIIGRKGKDISEIGAMDYVGGYTLCLDMTARDLQEEAKKNGLPWTVAKGFDTSCPVGSFLPKEQVADPHNLPLWCNVNGQVRQEGSTADMVFRIPSLISYISSYFTLEPGDVILTGTPAGVGPVQHGDIIEAGLGSLIKMSFKVQGEEKYI
ncbi:oxaloacetate tautomerase FAHD1, mitochondrial-like isoform X1 [Tachypleus tridentatus]|uniref:oxaloacetate tautomerase FAHD1, mitochondrial-like isoform X1 n=2 Tax=Tachypleus tridentatus TaxID=6853 RepID=UPI003FD51E82